jgi:acyl transferase domain-containing protein
MSHLESTVHWMDNVQALWNDYGVRLFVEVGPGETLSNLIADSFPEAACIRTCLPSAEGMTYKTALAQLFVRGHLKYVIWRKSGEQSFFYSALPVLTSPSNFLYISVFKVLIFQ